MDKKTLEALNGSIAKWEAIVAGTGKDEGGKNCPLCQMFCPENTDQEWCEGCPVKEKTERPNCDGSPYWKYNFIPTIENAQRELDFLRSLLPVSSAHQD